MRKIQWFVAIFFIGLISISAAAQDYSRGTMKPLPHEKLEQPIKLSDHCRDIRIIEWRPTPYSSNTTGLNNKSIEVVDNTCNLSVKSFFSFINKKGGYTISKDVKFDTSLSFMPADITNHGSDPRNLNDIRFRFVNRSDYSPMWGWFQRADDWAYIRNDVFLSNGYINKDFVKVTAHELFHAMSYTSGVFHQHPADSRERVEEKMAQEFTEYLGLGK